MAPLSFGVGLQVASCSPRLIRPGPVCSTVVRSAAPRVVLDPLVLARAVLVVLPVRVAAAVAVAAAVVPSAVEVVLMFAAVLWLPLVCMLSVAVVSHVVLLLLVLVAAAGGSKQLEHTFSSEGRETARKAGFGFCFKMFVILGFGESELKAGGAFGSNTLPLPALFFPPFAAPFDGHPPFWL